MIINKNVCPRFHSWCLSAFQFDYFSRKTDFSDVSASVQTLVNLLRILNSLFQHSFCTLGTNTRRQGVC